MSNLIMKKDVKFQAKCSYFKSMIITEILWSENISYWHISMKILNLFSYVLFKAFQKYVIYITLYAIQILEQMPYKLLSINSGYCVYAYTSKRITSFINLGKLWLKNNLHLNKKNVPSGITKNGNKVIKNHMRGYYKVIW